MGSAKRNGLQTAAPLRAVEQVVSALKEIRRRLPALRGDLPAILQARDRLEAMRGLLRLQRGQLQAQQTAAELKIETEALAGEELAALEKATAGRPSKNRSHRATDFPTLAELGVTKSDSSRWQKIHALGAAARARHIQRLREADEEVTTASVLRLIKQLEREARQAENRRIVEEAAADEVDAPPAPPTDTFPTIVIDPPWDWGDEGDVSQMGRGDPTYATIPAHELAAFQPNKDGRTLGDYADAHAHLYLWITNRSLPKGFALLDAWGFRYVTCLTWCKPSFGMGNYFRGSTEHVLFGVRGSQPLLRSDLGTWFQAERAGRHSAKPVAFYEMVESCSPGPWADFFARRQRPGWYCWGAEA